ncbi:hypothetical protein SRHO_G00055570 [Serrasalmus rhombeus]
MKGKWEPAPRDLRLSITNQYSTLTHSDFAGMTQLFCAEAFSRLSKRNKVPFLRRDGVHEDLSVAHSYLVPDPLWTGVRATEATTEGRFPAQ